MLRRALIALCLLALPIPASADDEAVLYGRAIDSVAWVITTDKEWGRSYGTGVLVDAQRGLVLTAYHVAADRLSGAVFPARDDAGEVINTKAVYNSRFSEHFAHCTLVSADARRDLALLKMIYPRPGLKAMPIAAKSGRPGQAIFSIGQSGDALWRFSGGAVRQVFDDSFKFASGQEIAARVVEMTVPINPGDSGGPIINHDGELVGINSCGRDHLQLVQKGIDVTEIRAFLAEAEAILKKKEEESLKPPKEAP